MKGQLLLSASLNAQLCVVLLAVSMIVLLFCVRTSICISWPCGYINSPGIHWLCFLCSLGNLNILKLLIRTDASMILFIRLLACLTDMESKNFSPIWRAKISYREAFYAFCQHHPEAEKSYLEKWVRLFFAKFCINCYQQKNPSETKRLKRFTLPLFWQLMRPEV